MGGYQVGQNRDDGGNLSAPNPNPKKKTTDLQQENRETLSHRLICEWILNLGAML